MALSARRFRGLLLLVVLVEFAATSRAVVSASDHTEFSHASEEDAQEDSFVTFVQPPTIDDGTDSMERQSRVTETRQRRRPRRLDDAPDMFGDLITRGLIQGVSSNEESFEGTFPLGRISKISEHNGVLPNHRVFFLYNHFHNALDLETSDFSGGGERVRGSIDRYTFGIERPFLDDRWSVELRMPLLGQSRQSTDVYSMSGGDYGNLAVILKRLVYESDQGAIALGMGIDLPTGSDIQGSIPFDSFDVRIRNEAVHLLPYVGFLSTPVERLYFQGFAQLDVPLNGNSVELMGGAGSFGPSFVEDGVLTEQTYLYLDLAAGYWLYQNPAADWLSGLAANVELHYSRALQNRDIVDLSGVTFGSSNADGVDILNFTVGLQASLSNFTDVRIGGVFPFEVDGQRCFDAEFQAAVIKRF